MLAVAHQQGHKVNVEAEAEAAPSGGATFLLMGAGTCLVLALCLSALYLVETMFQL